MEGLLLPMHTGVELPRTAWVLTRGGGLEVAAYALPARRRFVLETRTVLNPRLNHSGSGLFLRDGVYFSQVRTYIHVCDAQQPLSMHVRTCLRRRPCMWPRLDTSL